MRRYRLTDILDAGAVPEPHVFARILGGDQIYRGGVSIHRPGHITHDEERPHVEEDAELFCLLQGEGWIEIDGVREPAQAGDVLVIEPGEDHHLISSEHAPFVNLWLHAREHPGG